MYDQDGKVNSHSILTVPITAAIMVISAISLTDVITTVLTVPITIFIAIT